MAGDHHARRICVEIDVPGFPRPMQGGRQAVEAEGMSWKQYLTPSNIWKTREPPDAQPPEIPPPPVWQPPPGPAYYPPAPPPAWRPPPPGWPPYYVPPPPAY